jgi:hypothetical protein
MRMGSAGCGGITREVILSLVAEGRRDKNAGRFVAAGDRRWSKPPLIE